ncbi:extracellular solute-binding protein, partial [Candidatus Bipolaricaulota bacterium]|nr:extracellular solute-binding protein [Candidatus Bipolaricaulota bacterium]
WRSLGPWSFPGWKENWPKMVLNETFVTAPPPLPDDVNLVHAKTFADAKGLVIYAQRSSEEQAAIWKFIKWVFTDPENDLAWVDATGMLPMRGDLTTNATFAKVFEARPELRAYADEMPYAVPAMANERFADIQTALGEEGLIPVILGEKTPEQGWADAKAAIEAILRGPKVLHEFYATFPLTNQRILCWKYFDETSEEIAFDCCGNLEEAENKEMQRYDELYGKLSPELAYCLNYPDQCLEEFPQEYAEEFRNRGTIPVAIWLEASLPSEIEKVCISAKTHVDKEMSIEDVEREIQECFELQSNWYGQLRSEVVDLLNSRGYWKDETSYASIAAPLLYTELPIRDTSIYDELERLDLVDAIYLAGVGETKLDSAIPTIKANEVWDRQDTTGSGRGLYIEGKGIKIAVVESGRIDFTKDCFSFSYGEHVTRDNSLSTDKHKTRVAEV